ncbi:MAG: hypothetical protein H0W78_14305 [Planctomycetes bacterium]|nr:hypothetical protein [Planctomycetota bacterium]
MTVRPLLLLALMSLSVGADLTVSRDGHYLVIHGDLPGGELRINHIESYCRAGSTDADWVAHTKIPHRNELISLSDDQRVLRLRDTLSDGVVVDHTITAGSDQVSFQVSAHNPTAVASTLHWAQPCVRLGAFTGFNPDYTVGNPDDYLPRCFLFLDGKLTRMPTPAWTTTARYTPGQVWCPTNVPRTDVNPRPLNPQVPSNGLIGCFSGDGTRIAAMAWEPYQELFQGVARCLHADFRIGGLAAGETKTARGVLYLVAADSDALVQRYQRDFPEHIRR